MTLLFLNSSTYFLASHDNTALGENNQPQISVVDFNH